MTFRVKNKTNRKHLGSACFFFFFFWWKAVLVQAAEIVFFEIWLLAFESRWGSQRNHTQRGFCKSKKESWKRGRERDGEKREGPTQLIPPFPNSNVQIYNCKVQSQAYYLITSLLLYYSYSYSYRHSCFLLSSQ
jgi:hypothetical protein